MKEKLPLSLPRSTRGLSRIKSELLRRAAQQNAVSGALLLPVSLPCSPKYPRSPLAVNIYSKTYIFPSSPPEVVSRQEEASAKAELGGV